ncbi:MAG: hypothetical protein AAF665_19700 [Pseudomonadota bacterium]
MNQEQEIESKPTSRFIRIVEHPYHWTEVLDRVFSGWGPTEQAVEHLIDRWERKI